jgi:hypothetical protein
MRMHEFLAHKQVINLMRRESGTMRPRVRSSISRVTFKERDESRESKKRRIHKKPSRKTNTLSYRISLNRLKSRNTVIEFNAKEFLRNFEMCLNRADFLITESLNLQRNNFTDMFQKKRMIQLNNDSKGQTRNQSFIKRKTLNPDFRSSSHFAKAMINEESRSKMKHLSNNRLDISYLKSIDFSKLDFDDTPQMRAKKGSFLKKKNINLGMILNNFISKFKYTFYTTFAEKGLKICDDIIHDAFDKKRERWLDYFDHKAEFDMMMLENDSNH